MEPDNRPKFERRIMINEERLSAWLVLHAPILGWARRWSFLPDEPDEPDKPE